MSEAGLVFDEHIPRNEGEPPHGHASSMLNHDNMILMMRTWIIYDGKSQSKTPVKVAHMIGRLLFFVLFFKDKSYYCSWTLSIYTSRNS